MTFKVIFVDGKYRKVLYQNDKPHCDSTARFICFRNESSITTTKKTVTENTVTYTITVID